MDMLSPNAARWLIDASYLLVAFLFIMGLKRMSSPVTARSGILWRASACWWRRWSPSPSRG